MGRAYLDYLPRRLPGKPGPAVPVLAFLLAVLPTLALPGPRAQPGHAAEPAALVHQPPESARQGEDLRLTVRVVGDSAVMGEVFYRSVGGEYSVAPLLETGDHWTAYLPGDDLRPPAVEYYLRMETHTARGLTFPTVQPAEDPVALPVMAEESRVVVLSPSPGEAIDDTRPDIAALFDPPLPDATGLLALLDRRDVTDSAEFGPEFIYVTSPWTLSAGEHEVRVIYLDEDGEPREGSWRFTVGRTVAPAAPWIRIHGTAEAGVVSAKVFNAESEAFLRYPEGSEARGNLYTYGSAWGRDFSFALNRNPSIERATRWVFRLNGTGYRLAGGDIAPYLSEELLAGLPVDGLSLNLHMNAWRSQLTAVRTQEKDNSPYFPTYAQYLVGLRQEWRKGTFQLSVTGTYGFDDKESLSSWSGPAGPDSLLYESYELPPVLENWVWGCEAGAQAGGFSLKGGVIHSRIQSDTSRAEAWGYRLRLARAGSESVSLQFVSYRPGFYSLGSPWLDVGQEGLVAELRLGEYSSWRTSLYLKLYRDYESYLPLRHRRLLSSLTWRVESPKGMLGGILSPYAAFGLHVFPYRDVHEQRESLELGSFLDKRPLSGSLTVRFLRIRIDRDVRTWSLNGNLGYNQFGSGVRARVDASWYRNRDDRGVTDTRLPGARAELGYRRGRWEVRATGEWVRTEDRVVPERNYEEGLFSFLVGARF